MTPPTLNFSIPKSVSEEKEGQSAQQSGFVRSGQIIAEDTLLHCNSGKEVNTTENCKHMERLLALLIILIMC